MALDHNFDFQILEDEHNGSDDPLNLGNLLSTSKYITVDTLNSFFKFDDFSAINILHVNCRSLKKNFSPFKDLLNVMSHPLLAIAVSETWLSEHFQDVYSLPGYKFVSNSRVNKIGGGVGIYINETFEYKVRSDLSRMTSFIECIFIEICRVGKKNIIVGCVYRPPNTDLNQFNSEWLVILNSLVITKNTIVLIAGDFNLNLLKHNSHGPTGEFLNNMLSYNFLPTLSLPTRISDTSATLIDNIFVNCIGHDYTSALVYSDVSDHLPCVLHMTACISRSNLRNCLTKRTFDINSINSFHCDLAKTDWNLVINVDSSPNEMYERFFLAYKILFDKHFPQRSIKQSQKFTPRHEWMTKGLMKSCVKKSKLYKKFCISQNGYHKAKYIAYRNKLKTLLRKAEQHFFVEKFKSMSGNIKETWKLLGSLLNSNNSMTDITNHFTVDGIDVLDKHMIVEKFNNYFVNIGNNLAASIQSAPTAFSDYLKTPNLSSFVLLPVDAAEVVSIVSDLQSKWSAGVDCIPTSIMKSSIIYIAEPISKIVNQSFQKGTCPDKLKIAKICPIFKSGEKNIFSNYRPISILPSFSKIFEKAMSNRLMSFFESKNILIDNQFGFRKKRSTYMALLEMYENVSSAIDNQEFSVGIFIDLSKAFDTINHSILIEKLHYYGIRGTALDWFRSYLQLRSQYVYLNGVQSSMLSVTCGVPQGSILGPLLFILYINDINNCCDNLRLILFADDTNLFYSNRVYSELERIINTDLDKLSSWFKANKLSLNAVKTNFIVFGHKKIPRDLNLVLDGNVLDRTDCVKFLGIYVDEKLTWNNHLNYISGKISRSLGMISRVCRILPVDILKTLYYSMIYPYLLYCCIVWGGACTTSLHKLEVLQNRAVRLITRSPFRASSRPIFKQLNVLRLADIRQVQIALFMFEIRNSSLPKCCLLYCSPNLNNYYSMRNVCDFLTPAFRTNIREQSVSVLGPRLWNMLPLDVRSSVSLFCFKKSVRSHLISFY